MLAGACRPLRRAACAACAPTSERCRELAAFGERREQRDGGATAANGRTDWLRRPKQLYIDGRWCEATGSDASAVINPANGAALASVLTPPPADVDARRRCGTARFDRTVARD